MEDIRLALMCGTDIPIPSLRCILHQPKIKEIAMIGEREFFVGVQCLNLNKETIIQDKTLLETTNNFQIFMTIMSEQESKDKKQATEQLLSLLFPNTKFQFTPRSILCVSENGSVMIDENNFSELQNIAKEIFCVSNTMSQQSTGFNPVDEQARKIAEKLMRGRQRVAEIKGESNASIFSRYLSVLTVGLPSMSLQNLMDLTMYQLFDLIERYSLYINWDIDIRSRLAGGKPDDKPDNWMKNIH